MPFADVAGGRIYYERHGPRPGAAPAIVFAHGAGGNHLSWWQQAPHFRDRYACIVFDHRGFGQSVDGDGRGGAAFADDLRGLLDHLGIERAHLVAQSMGGWTCLRFAIRHPERVATLVMAATHGGLSTPEIDEAWRVSRTLRAELPDDVYPAAGARMRAEQPELHFLYRQIDALNPPRTDRDLARILQQAGRVTPDEVAALDIAVLFVGGDEDVVIPPQVLGLACGHFPDARRATVERSGHSVYFERAGAFNALVEDFLAS